MSQLKVVEYRDKSLKLIQGTGNRYGGAFLKASNAWTPKHIAGRYNVHLMATVGAAREVRGVSKRRAKAALLNWCRS